MDALRKQATSLDVRVSELEVSNRELRIQLGTAIARDNEDDKVPVNTLSTGVSDDQLNRLAERTEEIAVDMQAQFQTLASEEKNLARGLNDLLQSLNRVETVVIDGIDQRLVSFDFALTALKVDVESLRASLQDQAVEKASKDDVSKVAQSVNNCTAEINKNREILREASHSFEKLDDCYRLASAASEGMQETMRLFREEAAQTREWCSRCFSEVRGSVQALTAADTATQNRAEQQVDELRASVAELSERDSRLEAMLRLKAEGSDVIRLAEKMGLMASQVGKKTQMLLGTKCLTCDRPISPTAGGISTVTDRPVQEDAERFRQQETLYEEVHRALQASGGDQQSVQLVSVHVGRPLAVCDKSGRGQYKAVDLRDRSPGAYRLVGPAHVPTRPATGDHGGAPIPPRAPPREATPLVRMVPRQVARRSPAAGFGGRQEPPPLRTIRGALGGGNAGASGASASVGGGAGATPRQPLSKVPTARDAIDAAAPWSGPEDSCSAGGDRGPLFPAICGERDVSALPADSPSSDILPTMSQPGGSGCPAAPRPSTDHVEDVFDLTGGTA
eukprot:TRINITY_DN26625_c0_g3_i1.p1 TRINITY_DN26625_c0_g3~~TRINITY_DN26625_c0_g3_i1.p1  ORF type:complete len:645 (+),score=157.19 TRINITY_DN26625_c0_g3_i1:252-1937(+)